MLISLSALPGNAQAVGDTYRCSGLGTPTVTAVVLAIGKWDDYLSGALDDDVAAQRIAHIQILPKNTETQPPLFHTPLDARFLSRCRKIEPVPFDRDAFDEGFANWLAAVQGEGAGIWEMPPNQIYRVTLRMLRDNGVLP